LKTAEEIANRVASVVRGCIIASLRISFLFLLDLDDFGVVCAGFGFDAARRWRLFIVSSLKPTRFSSPRFCELSVRIRVAAYGIHDKVGIGISEH
jgi:hypothetical protein